jgi:endonuclease/exonuclease/phosphatase family metal-dependent hydrolase
LKKLSPERWIRLLLLIGATLAGASSLRAQDYVRDSEPKLFSYDELVQLSLNQPMSPELTEKLRIITATPFINNEAYYRGARPRPLGLKELGPSLRVACWNIERGLKLDDIQLFLTDKDRFMAKVETERKKAKESGRKIRVVALEKIPQEIESLKAADVWVLNEVDWGVKRTQYREVVRELAETLNMNWAYGVEFLEVDSKQLGTDTFEDKEDEQARQQLLEQFRVDKDRVRALHGNAVMSRYPIRGARLIPFKAGYDWFREENKIRPLEKGKRKAAILIGEDLQREVRRGGRTTLFVDLDIPDVSGQRLTIAATHLENRTRPKVRRQQMEELLNEVRETRNPVVVAGDLNTTGSDSTPRAWRICFTSDMEARISGPQKASNGPPESVWFTAPPREQGNSPDISTVSTRPSRIFPDCQRTWNAACSRQWRASASLMGRLLISGESRREPLMVNPALWPTPTSG